MSKTMIPGIAAQHAIITAECIKTHGFEGAFDEAARRLKLAYIGCRDSIDGGSEVHVVVTIDHSTNPRFTRPRDVDG